jgi:hypothetical protein
MMSFDVTIVLQKRYTRNCLTIFYDTCRNCIDLQNNRNVYVYLFFCGNNLWGDKKHLYTISESSYPNVFLTCGHFK